MTNAILFDDGNIPAGKCMIDKTSLPLNTTNSMITCVCNVNVTCSIYSNAPNIRNPCLSRRAAVAAVIVIQAISSYGCNDTAGIYFSYAIIGCKLNVSPSIYGNFLRPKDLSLSGRSAVAAIAPITIAGYGCNDAGCIYFSYAVIPKICNVNVT